MLSRAAVTVRQQQPVLPPSSSPFRRTGARPTTSMRRGPCERGRARGGSVAARVLDENASDKNVAENGWSSSLSTRALTSEDLARWIATRGSTVELVRCPGSETPDVASSAAALGVDVSCIVKSLVFACDGDFVVVVTNGETRVDTKKIARRLGIANKRVRLASPAETIAECGFAPGTVPPFGHRRELPTFVDEQVPLVSGGVVWGGGGDIDMEVKVEVDELLRLTDGELMDVKQVPKPSQQPTARRSQQQEREQPARAAEASGSEEDASTPPWRARSGSPAPEMVEAPTGLDERSGPERRLIAKDVASIMGKVASGATMSTAPATVISVTAEVMRVRRVARFLAFATLRPLATPTVVLDGEDDGAEKSSAEPHPLTPGVELQLIAGRSLMAHLGGEEAMEALLRRLKPQAAAAPGAVVTVVGRLQANPRPNTVDLVSRSVVFIDPLEALEIIAAVPEDTDHEPQGLHVDGDAAAGGRKMTSTALDGAVSCSESEDRSEDGGGGPMEVDRVLAQLTVGNRQGKMSQFPALPDDRVHFVDDAAGVLRMRAAVLDERASAEGSASDLPPNVVGLDAEWRPRSGTPVAVLQVATRHEVFLVDMIELMADEGVDEPASSVDTGAGSVLLDAFLADLLASKTILKLGFGFSYDLSRMQRSYPSLGSVFGVMEGLVDVKAVTLVAFPEKKTKLAKAGLATVVASILGMYIDKTEQCSDWQRRPLSHAQIAYAASDAHCLTVLFDRCYNYAPGVVTEALEDPTRPLAAPPPPPPSPRRKPRGPTSAIQPAVSKMGWGAREGPDGRGIFEYGRRTLGPPLTAADVPGMVGRAFDGRRGVVDAITGGLHDGRGGGGRGGVEECGDFMIIYVNVGKGNRKYRNEFWVDKKTGKGYEGDTGGDAGDVAVLMSWFSGKGAQGGVQGVARILAAASNDDVHESGGGDKKTAILFLRTQGGPYVCCGRLRAAATKMDRQTGMRVDFRLQDARAMVTCGVFDELIGEHLNDPEDRDLFTSGSNGTLLGSTSKSSIPGKGEDTTDTVQTVRTTIETGAGLGEDGGEAEEGEGAPA